MCGCFLFVQMCKSKFLFCATMKLSIIYYVSEKECKIFFFHIFTAQLNLFLWWDRQLWLKLLFCDILRMICYIEFKCGSINFHKLRTQPKKYQYLGIAFLNCYFKPCLGKLFYLVFNLVKSEEL